MDPDPIPHQPYYCEENAWRLLATTSLVRGPAEVVLVANRFGRVACWAQRAATAVELPVLWDYHVVVAEALPDGARRIWDPDSWIGPIAPAAAWLAATFLDPSHVRARYHPRFRVVPADRWIDGLATDRAHMRDRRGRWLKPPPPWDPPGADRPANLFAWLDQDHPDWIDRARLEQRWGIAPPPA